MFQDDLLHIAIPETNKQNKQILFNRIHCGEYQAKFRQTLFF